MRRILGFFNLPGLNSFMLIPEDIRMELKKPLGRIETDFQGITRLRECRPSLRIISIGDICTLGLLENGLMPQLAVFDFQSMRAPLPPEGVRALRSAFRSMKRYRNPPGTLSEELLDEAGALIEEGGAILIEGEEDLTALAFILAAKEEDIVVYGQPEQGMVVVSPGPRVKAKVMGWIRRSGKAGGPGKE